MDILVKGKDIIAEAQHIDFGVYENEPKWRMINDEDVSYLLNKGYLLVKNVTLPSDFESGKYYFESGSFVKNPDYTPYMSENERLKELEEASVMTADTLEYIMLEVLPMLMEGGLE